MSAHASEAKRIFLEAVEKHTPDQWPRFLDEACGGDSRLREHVEALLKAHGESNPLLDGTGVAATMGMPPITEGPGTVIGRYKLLEQIGEGGMGLVFMARQQEPVKRNVALKIIKPGMDTRQVIARFEAERQALAMMDHPNIAKVLDAGTTEDSSRHTPCAVRLTSADEQQDQQPPLSPPGRGAGGEGAAADGTRRVPATYGRPYFVMELVKGIPITEYCDQERLSTRERLELFIPVCQAVQHAHQRGIIHRDIKPTNVLVTLHDGTPVPKVIDFGVAKAINREVTQESLLTGFAQVIGTPLYMSPEQAEMSGLDVDTRTDVYALGVLLYELLTGTTPFEQERFSEASYDEMRRIIREEEPPNPSTRISTLGDSLTTIAEKRHTDARTLTQQVRGELDWIVMKALEKDRTRRYESANELAKDVQRHLDDEPVEACPPSTAYRLRKFARRHKAQIVTVATIAIILVVATVVSSCLAAWAFKAEGVARTNLAQSRRSEAAALDARTLAKRQERLAKQQRDAAEYDNYVSSIRLAQYDWETGQSRRLIDTLNGLVPEPDRPDFRGWEWYYLFSQCHAERYAFRLQGHGESDNRRRFAIAWSIAWSPDGKSLATADPLGLVNIWDVGSGQLHRSLEAHGLIHSISWSRDGSQIAAGGDRRAIVIWDGKSGKKTRSLRGHVATVNCIDWSPGDTRLASGGEDGTISIWNFHTGERVSSLGAPTRVSSLDWHPDGRQLLAVTGGDAGTGWIKPKAHVFDTADGRKLAEWEAAQAEFSPDGRHVVSQMIGGGNSYPVRVTDWRTQELISEFPVQRALRSTWSGDGSQLATVLAGGTIEIHDAETGTPVSSITTDAQEDASLVWSPTGPLLAAGCQGGTVKVWDATAVRQSMVLATPGRYALSVAFSPDGRRLLVGARHGALKVWDVESGEDVLSIQHGARWHHSVAWSRDGKRFAAGSTSGLSVHDAETGELLPSPDCEETVLSLAWHPDGMLLAARCMKEHFGSEMSRVRLWDMTDCREIATSPYMRQGPGDVVWQPDGKLLASRGWVWDAERCEEATVPVAGGWWRPGDWSPDGRHLAAASGGGNITIYDATTWEPIAVGRGNGASVRSMTLHPHMPRLASVSYDNIIRIWDTQTGRQLFTLQGHAKTVTVVDWSPDGLRLARGGYDESVRIWDGSLAGQFLKRHGDLREQAWRLLEEKEYREAVAILKRLHVLYPEEKLLKTYIDRLQWLQASQLARDGQVDDAIALWQQLTAETPQLPDYRLRLPAIMFEAGNQTEAIELLEGFIAESPEKPEYRDELAFLYQSRATQLCQSGEFDEAVPLLRKLAETFPEWPDFRAELAFQMARADRLEETMATLEKIAEACSHWPDYRPELARRLLRSGEAAVAATVYERLVKEYPDVPEYRENLAGSLGASGQADEAIAIQQKLIEEFPENTTYRQSLAEYRVALAKFYFAQGDRAYHQGDFEKAFPDLDRAIQLNPEYSQALDHRGHIHRARGDLDKAIADYDKSIESGAAYGVDTYMGRGLAYVGQKKFDEAIADFTKAVELDNDEAIGRYRLALAHLAAGHIEHYRTACAGMQEQFGGSKGPDEAHWLAWTCALAPEAVSDFSAAVAAAERAVESQPQSARYLNTLGAILYRAGRTEEAVEELTKADELIEDADKAERSSPAYTSYFLAMAHHKLGHDEEAEKWLNKANEWTDKVLRDHEEGTTTLAWNRRLTLKLLREEAEGLIANDD